jgi:hypothetical protein
MFHTVITSTGDPTRAVVDRISTAASTDPGTTIGTAIVLVVLLVGGAIALFIWLRMRASEKARIAAMSPAERERHEAQLEYRARVAAAEKALDAATKERSARLKASEKALAQAQAVGVHRVASYRGKDGAASITATDIMVPQGTFPLTGCVSATVDTAGNLASSSRSTLTRLGAGALLFGPVGAIVGHPPRRRECTTHVSSTCWSRARRSLR